MPDGLYDRDILAWSEHQAELLRRLARGERVNDVDWEHVIEEIEDVGRSELHSVESNLYQLLLHLLKMRRWPGSPATDHWRGEIFTFQRNAGTRFTASMRPRLKLEEIYADAVKAIQETEGIRAVRQQWPARCPFTLDELLKEPRTALMDRLAAAMPESQGPV